MKTGITSSAIQYPRVGLLTASHANEAADGKSLASATPHTRRASRLPVRPALLPHRYRVTLIALAAFYRETRTLGLAAATPDGSARLDVWEAAVREMDNAHAVPHPVLTPLAAACLPQQPLLDLIEAQRLRVHTFTYNTYNNLLHYCVLGANSLGRLVLAMLGDDDLEHVALTDAFCTALLQTQLWRDIARDYVRGRIYLPQEDLCLFGVSESDLAMAVRDRQASANLRALIAFEVERTRYLLDDGAQIASTLKRRARLNCALLAVDARAMLITIARHGYDPFVMRPTLGRFERFEAMIGTAHLLTTAHPPQS